MQVQRWRWRYFFSMDGDNKNSCARGSVQAIISQHSLLSSNYLHRCYLRNYHIKWKTLSQLLICSAQKKKKEEKKTCGLRYWNCHQAPKEHIIKYIFMRKAWTLFNVAVGCGGVGVWGVQALVRHCQLVLYSRRSLMIHYGADVSRVLVLRGI